jgi:tetratricopeptide (TPR) repeat protein
MQANVESRKALIVAISDYDKLQPLNFCRKDGEEMYKILKSVDYEILLSHKLIGRVGWEEMRPAMIDFFQSRNVKPKDTLLFYYSGHGLLDSHGDHYFARSPLDPFQPDIHGVPFDDLGKMMNKSNSQKIVAVLDCCYSGDAPLGKGGGDEEEAANAGRKALDEKSNMLELGEGKCILAASQPRQKAFQTAQQDHSLFTYYLIEGLRGNEESVNHNGYVTADSLGGYAYDKIMSLPPEERFNQKPIRKGQLSGDIVLARYPHLARIRQDYKKPVSVLAEDLQAIKNNCKRYFSAREFKKELDYLEEAVDKYPKDSELWNYMGVALINLSRYEEATNCFEKSIILNANNSQSWANKGIALEKLSRYSEAMKDYDNALNIDANYDDVWNHKGRILYSLGRYQEAIYCFDRILVLNPNMRQVLINKSKALDKLGKYEEAQRCYKRAQNTRVDNKKELYDSNGKRIS